MVDQEKVREGVRLILEGIGEDINREGLIETPDRIARMCEQIYGGLYGRRHGSERSDSSGEAFPCGQCGYGC